MPGALAVELSHEWAVGVSYQQYCWVIHLYIPLAALVCLHTDGSSTLPVIFLTLEACTVGRRKGLEYTANCMWRPLSAASESKHIRSKNCIRNGVSPGMGSTAPPQANVSGSVMDLKRHSDFQGRSSSLMIEKKILNKVWHLKEKRRSAVPKCTLSSDLKKLNGRS